MSQCIEQEAKARMEAYQEAWLRDRGWEQDSVGRWFPPATADLLLKPMSVLHEWDRKHASDGIGYPPRRRTRGGVWPKPKRRARVGFDSTIIFPTSDDFKDLTET